MWKLTKVLDYNRVTFRMSGHLEAKHLVEIQKALAEEEIDENVVLDLSDVTVISQEAVRFLAHGEVNRIELGKSPAYIRQWVAQEKRAMKRRKQSESTG